LREDVLKGGQIPEMPVDLLGCAFLQVPLLVPAPVAVFFKPRPKLFRTTLQRFFQSHSFAPEPRGSKCR